ncbi:SusC/RagA family TonB-linked outer membrane protein [Siphonobacter aquaeclarae]|uniref:TonB-linked outer membrane protein, SusC/RagA family n=1 Tax=Siphonobacter aquaeclarae TaxID=563176 RepID=A0A1G9QHW4_9BACT|nr:SusC/RagA family TonB-linked outer membrane protein [Siphonobacter aquaeclarae]SDM10593.1 TonB-linked outer membrane protein, SusC/RagA family [Siphonobacter aquaeclarae]
MLHTLLRAFRLVLLVGAVVSGSVSWAQDRVVTGKVTDETGSPLPGVSVLVKGTSRGVSAGADGGYRIQAGSGQTLVFSMVGMTTKEVAVAAQTVIDVVLASTDSQLNEVVVTALGIKQEKRALGYSVGEIKGGDLVNAQRDNYLVSLQGRVAGLNVTTTSGMPGSSTSIQLRGAASIGGNNQPLFVVDGLPIDNRTTSGGVLYSNRANRDIDYLNKASNINFNDIESMTILKGPEAAALYGIDAAAGAIVITTKSGKSGRTQIDYSNNFRFSEVYRFPEVQQVYGRGTAGYTDPNALSFFGPKYAEGSKMYDNIGNFFRTGFTQTHNLSFSGGTERATYNLSTQYVGSEGIVPTTSLKNFNVKLTSRIKLSDKMSLQPSLTYINVDNVKVMKNNSGFVIALLSWPGNDDASNYLNADGSRRILLSAIRQGEPDNPYFSIYKNHLEDITNQTRANIQWEYTPLDWLKFNARFGGDIYSTRSNIFLHPESWQAGNGAGVTGGFSSGGSVEDAAENSRLLNGNFLATMNKKFGKLNTTLILGTAIDDRDYRTNVMYGQKLYDANFNSVNNTDPATQRDKYSVSKQRTQGIFGSLSLNYEDWLYLTLTGRNDWSSTLPKKNWSFFYPSAALSYVFTDMPGIKGNTGILNAGKIRLAYGQTGNPPPPYFVYPRLVQQTTYGGGYGYDFYGGNTDLQAERGESFELGTELKFFDDRLGIDAAYYQKSLSQQIVQQRLSYATGFIFGLLNGGSFQNKGVEIQLTGMPVKTKDFRWNVTLNFTKLKTVVSSLPAQVPEYYNSDTWLYGQARASAFVNNLPSFFDASNPAYRGFNWNYYQRGMGSATAIGGYSYQRNKNGDILINPATGLPIQNPNFLPIGDRNPDFTIGLQNSFTYRNLTLSFLLDIRKGGDVFNGTEMYLWRTGLSKKTLNRETPVVFKGVLRDGREDSDSPTRNTIQVNPTLRSADYFNAIPESEFVEKDINWVRLRDVTLRYQVPSSVLTRSKLVKSASIFVNGTDLFLLTNYTGADPNVNGTTAASGGVGGGGFDFGTVSMPRGFAFGISLGF